MNAELFPAFIRLENRRCLVVGAGLVAATKIASLLRAGARIDVIAPEAGCEVVELAAAGKVVWRPRRFRTEDLKGIFLVVAATSDSAVNHQVFSSAQERGILCNAVDDPPNCDFYFPAVVRRGDFQIAISTAGLSPSVAQRLRRAIEASLDSSFGDWLRFVGALRQHVLANHPPSDDRKNLLNCLAFGRICDSKDCQDQSGSIQFEGRHIHLPEQAPDDFLRRRIIGAASSQAEP